MWFTWSGRRVVTQGQDVPAVVARGSPGRRVANGSKLPAHPIGDKVFDAPGLGVLGIRSIWKLGGIEAERLTELKALLASADLGAVVLDLEEILEETLLEIVKIVEGSTGPKFVDETGNDLDTALLGGVLHNRSDVLCRHGSEKVGGRHEGRSRLAGDMGA